MKTVSSLSDSPVGAEGLVAFAKGSEKAIFSFVPPSAGMFIWARFYLMSSPKFLNVQANHELVDPEQVFSDYVWAELAKSLVGFYPLFELDSTYCSI
jgi:aromatic amino acid aminotransferase I